MNRNQLRTEALRAAKHARHNLVLIQLQPERINHGKHSNAVALLEMLIRFEKYELAVTRSPLSRLLDRLRGVMQMKIKSS